MTDPKDPTLIEYENLIEQLMKENNALKKRVTELEEENDLLRHIDYSFNEPAPPTDEKEAKKSLKLYKRIKKNDKIDSSEPIQVEIIEAPETLESTELEILTDLETPVPTIRSSDKPIVEGYSRRQCPHCDNNRQMFIHEEIDKTNIIMAYPRIYGKKYKCGVCGTYWRVPTTE
ncbi:MAG: hypothetical protein ACFFG0_10095 [Candidatus Thorarchaeota archaeon]